MFNKGIIRTMKTQKVQKKNKKYMKEKTHPVITKLLLRIVTVILIALLFSLGAYLGFSTLKKVKAEATHAMIDRQLSYCQELVAAKYRYSDIVTIKKSLGFSKSYSIVKYTGVIRVGIADVTDVSYSISRNGKKIRLSVPKTEVLGNDLVRQEVFDEKQSIFVPITTQDIFDEIEVARQQAAEDMIAEGVLQEAYTYAVKIIRQFMLSCGFEEVIIE